MRIDNHILRSFCLSARQFTVLTDDFSLERYNGRKVIITVLEDDKLCNSIPDEKLFEISDSLISQNIEAYKELAQ